MRWFDPAYQNLVVGSANTTLDGSETTLISQGGALREMNILDLSGVVNVKSPTYGAKGDGSTDDTTAIQAAINAVIEGGTVFFPSSSGHYVYSQLTVSRTVTFLGQGWHCPTLGVFGDSGYTSSTTGSVLRSSKTSSGNCIVSQTINKGPRFKSIAILGPGSGTSTGIGFGDGTDYQLLGKWDDVLIANFNIGLTLTNVEDFEFSSLRVRGCQTDGIILQSGIAGTNTNQNVFVNLELQKNGVGMLITEASDITFYGGLVQGNTTGVKFAPSASGRIGSIHFDGTWTETNTTPFAVDLTNGGMTDLSLTGLVMQETTNLFALTNPNNNTITRLTLRDNVGAGITADFSPGVSAGPAYVLINGEGNSFSATVRSNASFVDFFDGATYFSTLKPQVIAQSWSANSCPADTNEDTLATITIKKNSMGKNGSVRVTTLWTTTNSGNNKTLRVRFSGASGTQYTAQVITASDTVRSVTQFGNRNATNSQVGFVAGSGGFGASTGGTVTSAVDTAAADTTVVITGQKASSGETLTLEGYLVELFPSVSF